MAFGLTLANFGLQAEFCGFYSQLKLVPQNKNVKIATKKITHERNYKKILDRDVKNKKPKKRIFERKFFLIFKCIQRLNYY